MAAPAQVQIDIVAGPQGAVFQPSTLTICADTMCLWRNLSGVSQEVLAVDATPPFKGGPLEVARSRLVLAKRVGTCSYRLASHPTACLSITVY
jgi:hypothetical protein